MNKIAVVVVGVIGISILSAYVLLRPYESSQNIVKETAIPTPTSITVSESLSVENSPQITNSAVTPTDEPKQERKDTMIQAQTRKQYTSPPEMAVSQEKKYTAQLETNKGTMTIELFVKDAPAAVNNFVFLAKEGFYTNTLFHRVIRDFMIQGGDPTGTGMGGPGYRFNDETITKDYTRGTLAMANAGPNTNGSQFFIMHKDVASLPKNYVIFGSIAKDDVNSFATLDALLSTPVGRSSSGEASKPLEDLILKSVNIIEK